jgi:hypothetical protein
VPLEDLPHVDEHAVDVAAPEWSAWEAALATLRSAFGGTGPRRAAALLGCDPRTTTAWDAPDVGSTVPGFRVVAAEPPRLLVVAGQHRFSRYGIVFRVQPTPAGCRVRAETRAAFPGPHGALYRLAVIGSRGHVLLTRRLLGQIARRAERRSP